MYVSVTSARERVEDASSSDNARCMEDTGGHMEATQ